MVSMCIIASAFLVFFAKKRCPIEGKIPGSIGILTCCASFQIRDMNVCPTCEASLSHHTLCLANLV